MIAQQIVLDTVQKSGQEVGYVGFMGWYKDTLCVVDYYLPNCLQSTE
jgi:hypothetical protein